jgi:hypothetical protein
MADNSRTVRLRIQQDNLVKLASRSDFISVTPLEVRPGWPPEKYLISYTCRGIVGVRQDGQPVVAEHHQLKMYLDHDYPRSEPHLLFLTPLWHPNVSFSEPRKVCTDRAKSWWAGKDLDELVLLVGEMVQYKIYHAKEEPPFPQDVQVAQWVRSFAEPRGLIRPEKPLDDRPLLRPHRIAQNNEPPRSPRIKLGEQLKAEALTQRQTDGVSFVCPRCGAQHIIETNQINRR